MRVVESQMRASDARREMAQRCTHPRFVFCKRVSARLMFLLKTKEATREKEGKRNRRVRKRLDTARCACDRRDQNQRRENHV